jgi:hypothetical protein
MPAGFTHLILTICCLLCLNLPSNGMALYNGTNSDTQAISIVDTPVISIVTDKQPGPPAAYALHKLEDKLAEGKINFQVVTSLAQAKGKSILVAGLASGEGEAAVLLKRDRHSIDKTAEALTVWHTGWHQKPVWVVTGFDYRGLMYGLLDITGRVGWSKEREAKVLPSPLSEVKAITEKPYVSERAVSIYTMNRSYWESRFYSEAYWAAYLDMLAENRFNSLVVIFGYENGGFLAPCYPYFFNVPGFPDVRMVGLTAEQQQRNLLALNRLIQMAHERGIRFTVGIWDHIYRGGVQGGGIPGNEKAPDHPTPGLVWGVTGDNLTAYTKAALAGLIKQVPGLDGIQFRMHDESGLKKGEQESFWTDVFKMIKETKPELRLDLRAKGLPESVIRVAVNTGIKFRITTKYWMEQMGLPYHPTRINPDNSPRRQSYSDLLRYPKEYTMDWQLWNGGTTRILLWGDPEYVRRFVQSTFLYDGGGYAVNEPLATKMEAQPHDARPFDLLQPSHRYYTWEFQRYWHFFQVFGRIGYNPETPSDTWDKEFQARFGTTAGPLVEEALHRASWILPRIVASCYPYSYFPTTRGWAEKQRMGDLPEYAKAEGSDLCQFANFDEEAQLLLDGGETAKIRPSANSQWFEQTAADVLRLVDRINHEGSPQNRELSSTVTDLEILSNLARYHARRIPAAIYYRLFEKTRDPAMLDSAIAHERIAIEAWRQIVRSAGDFYAYNLLMGVSTADLTGHWKDELVLLEQGEQKLEQQRTELDPTTKLRNGLPCPVAPVLPFSSLFQVRYTPVDSVAAGQPISIRLTISAPAGLKWVRLCYRAVNQELSYQTIPMAPVINAEGAGGAGGAHTGEYQATIPADQINPKWDLMYYIEMMDNHGNGRIFPDLNQETPYKIIKLIR